MPSFKTCLIIARSGFFPNRYTQLAAIRTWLAPLYRRRRRQFDGQS